MCGGLMSRVDFVQAHSNEDDSSITAEEATLPAHKRISFSGWKRLPPSYIDLRGGISFFRKSPIEWVLVRLGAADIQALLGRFGLPCSRRLSSLCHSHVTDLVDCEAVRYLVETRRSRTDSRVGKPPRWARLSLYGCLNPSASCPELVDTDVSSPRWTARCGYMPPLAPVQKWLCAQREKAEILISKSGCEEHSRASCGTPLLLGVVATHHEQRKMVPKGSSKMTKPRHNTREISKQEKIRYATFPCVYLRRH
jgi:hypothetical protein